MATRVCPAQKFYYSRCFFWNRNDSKELLEWIVSITKLCASSKSQNYYFWLASNCTLLHMPIWKSHFIIIIVTLCLHSRSLHFNIICQYRLKSTWNMWHFVMSHFGEDVLSRPFWWGLFRWGQSDLGSFFVAAPWNLYLIKSKLLHLFLFNKLFHSH